MDAAKAEAERIRMIGEAEAHTLKVIGVSEADRMRLKASIYKKYGDAAILNLVLNAMPKVFEKCNYLSYIKEKKYIIISF